MNRLAMRLCASVIALSIGLVLSPLARAAVVADPTGDTFNTGTIDLAGIGVTPGLPTATFTLTFASAVAAPSAFAPNSLLGFLSIDADQNVATGGSAPWGGPVTGGNNWINFFIEHNPGTPTVRGPFVALGDEFASTSAASSSTRDSSTSSTP